MKAFLFLLLTSVSLTAFSQNYIDKYLTEQLTYATIASTAIGIDKPKDLDFKPNTNELWVCNHNGAMNIIYNAGQPNQSWNHRQDSHAGHFMVQPNAIAFSDIGEFANTNEVQNTSSPNSTFMGPALWSSDTNIFARVLQNNWQSGFPLGSHVDMLHQSPYSMGIAHETARIYWVFDGWNGNLCKYDYNMHHGPGYDDHSDGKIYRYSDIQLTRLPGIPSHMVKDKKNTWLYIVDGGTKKVIRVQTNTGTVAGNLNTPPTGGEYLAEYKNITGALTELVDTYTTQPCGIDHYNDRLIVSDYTTGDIYVYNTAGISPVLLGTIHTGQAGIMGVKIGTDGKIWFVNNTQSTVVRIDPQPAAFDASITEIISPKVINYDSHYHSPAFNHCSPTLAPSVVIKNTGTNVLVSLNIEYLIDGQGSQNHTWTGSLASGNSATVNLPPTVVTSGEHKLTVSSSLPNGANDDNPLNDTKEGSFRSRSEVVSLPFLEEFTSTTFPPASWSYIGFNKFAKMSWHSTGGYGASVGAAKMDNTSGGVDITGQTDFLLTPLISFSNTGSGTKMAFDVAYAQYNTSTKDRLTVKASQDCGVTWNQVYDKAGSVLATASPSLQSFVPEGSQWRTEIIDLDLYQGVSELLFLFTATSNFGNNLYIDNIQINKTFLGIETNRLDNFVEVYPVPSTGAVNIRSSSSIKRIEVADVLGRKITVVTASANEKEKILDLSQLSGGTYFIKVESMAGNSLKKIILAKP